ncbi:MAG: four helix bundle protein [Deltaproteobacteria bacterium]|nr:four helix bundle protein [Deltaproteobacteria bacterium]
MFSYQKLDVWQMAKKLIVFIYEITRNFPQEEKYGLVSQINRAAISVASNIAEGSGRTSYKDQAHFTQTAYGSLMEIACQFEIAKDLGFIDDLQLDNILNRIVPLADKLSALRKSQLNRFTNKP